MALTNGLIVADVAHARNFPKKNAFRYRVYYLCFALSAMQQLRRLTLLSLGRFNLFGFVARDYGDRSGAPEIWARGVLAEWNLMEADGEIVLLTMPRLLGFAFNPVSFWFCLDRSGALRAVISEVTNTFRDRHCYLSFRDDHAPITGDDWLRAEKVFHVSPFLDVTGHYRFRFVYSETKIGVWINHHLDDSDEGLVVATSLTGRRQALTSGALVRAMLRSPLAVIALIHFQAGKLILKGVRYHRRPTPPDTEISR